MTHTHLSPRQGQATQRSAIGRSFDVYYRDRDRTQRMDRLNAAFVPPGARVFDIGAHVGDRTGSFLRLGASVVALEPQPRVFRALRLLYGRCPRARLLAMAAGSRAGEIALHLNADNPTVASVDEAFIAAAAGASGWREQVWDATVDVPVTTLDELIASHGRPDFAKIDVEGHELSVLQGLTMPVPALSFEFTTMQRSIVHECIDRLNALARYEYNFSLGEEHVLRAGAWLGPDALRAALDALPDAANSGDVYARAI